MMNYNIVTQASFTRNRSTRLFFEYAKSRFSHDEAHIVTRKYIVSAVFANNLTKQ